MQCDTRDINIDLASKHGGLLCRQAGLILSQSFFKDAYLRTHLNSVVCYSSCAYRFACKKISNTGPFYSIVLSRKIAFYYLFVRLADGRDCYLALLPLPPAGHSCTTECMQTIFACYLLLQWLNPLPYVLHKLLRLTSGERLVVIIWWPSDSFFWRAACKQDHHQKKSSLILILKHTSE